MPLAVGSSEQKIEAKEREAHVSKQKERNLPGKDFAFPQKEPEGNRHKEFICQRIDHGSKTRYLP